MIQIQCTCESAAQAETISQALVAEKLVACAQIISPIRSIYRWQGKIEQSSEFLCLMKTKESLFDAVAAHIRSLHSYQCPEIIALPIVNGSPDYLEWIQNVTQ